MEQKVDVVGHDGIGVYLNPAEIRHAAYLVDDVGLVIVVKPEGSVNTPGADIVEAFAIVLQSQFSHSSNLHSGGGARLDASFPRIYKAFCNVGFPRLFSEKGGSAACWTAAECRCPTYYKRRKNISSFLGTIQKSPVFGAFPSSSAHKRSLTPLDYGTIQA
jgi:hypothetical protein